MVLISRKICFQIFFITYLFIITIAEQIKEEKSAHGLGPLPIDPDIEADVIQNGDEDSIVKELSQDKNGLQTPNMDGKSGAQLEESQDDTISPKESPEEGEEDDSCSKDLTLDKVIDFLKKQFKQREHSERVTDENVLKFLKYRLKTEDPMEIEINSALDSEKTGNLKAGSDLLTFDRSTDSLIADEIRELLEDEKQIMGDGLNPSKESLTIDDLKENDSFELVENSVEQDKEAENIGDEEKYNRRLQSYILKAEKNLTAEKAKETSSTKAEVKEHFMNGKVEKKEFNELVNSEEKEESKEELIRATEEVEDYEEVAQEEQEETDVIEEDYSELNYNDVKKNEKGSKDEEVRENENEDLSVEKENNYKNLPVNAVKEDEVDKHSADEKREESGEKIASNDGPKKRRRKKHKGHHMRRKHHKKKTSNRDVKSENVKENNEMTKEETNAEDPAIIEVIGTLPSAMRITNNKEEVDEEDTEELVPERVVDWKEI